MNNKKFSIYKNDLKFNSNFDLENSEWESDIVKDIYNDYNKKPKIELRIKDSEMENYEYLDLSNLGITDDILKSLLELNKIKNILNKISFLDLSENNLIFFPDLSKYLNIIYLNIGHNSIKCSINNNNLIELSCENNKINNIVSTSITKLSASSNIIEQINIPNIKVLVINNNKLTNIDKYENLEYLECIDNSIDKISCLNNLEELYISNNKLTFFNELSKLSIINCTNNPIKKINYLDSIKLIVCSTPIISSKYNINNISKVKNDYIIEIKK